MPRAKPRGIYRFLAPSQTEGYAESLANPFIYRIYAESPAISFIYRIYANTPGCGRPSSPFLATRQSSLATFIKLFVFNSLRTLYLSCGSFSDSRPLFSIVCVLFGKKPARARSERLGPPSWAAPFRSLLRPQMAIQPEEIYTLRPEYHDKDHLSVQEFLAYARHRNRLNACPHT